MSLDKLQKNIDTTFKDQNLLVMAFVHRSYLNEDKKFQYSNERLEFLGDAILSFLTSEYLYKKYPEFPEGTLTNIRSSLVKTQTLANISKKLELGKLLYLSRGEEDSGGRDNPSLLADVFESLLGAIYLDKGIKECNKFLNNYLFIYTNEIVVNKKYVDYKSHLQEIVQETSKISPVYKVVDSSGPDHNKTFHVASMHQGKKIGEGKGKSKQTAEQEAAKHALEKMHKK